MGERDDLELLDAWREGDSEASEILFRRHFARIYRFFKHKVGDEAEDLTQRTFLALIENRTRLRPGSNFVAYAFGIARNQLLMHFRRAGVARETDLGSCSLVDLSGKGVETGLREGEELRLVLDAMRRLPLDFQLTLELYYWEDLSIAEIAEALEVSRGTVKSRLFRGREQLREEIEAIVTPEVLRQSTLGELQRWLGALQARRSEVP